MAPQNKNSQSLLETALYMWFTLFLLSQTYLKQGGARGTLKTMIQYIRLWWHLSMIDKSTSVSLIRFGLVAKIRSIHKEDSLVIWVGLLINWL